MMRKNLYLFLLVAAPLFIIFLSFFNPGYGGLVRRSIIVFTVLAVPYCLFVKDPRRGLILFLLEASLLEGAWKHFTYGMNLKLLVYIIRDLLLYASLLNFLMHKKRILPKEVLRQRPPYTGVIFIFLLNVAIQIFNPANYNFLSAIANSRLFWEMVPLYWMGFYLMRNRNSFRILCWLCILCVFFNSGATVLQYYWSSERIASISSGYHAMVYEWGRGIKGKLRPPGLGSDMGTAGHYFTQIVIMMIILFIIPQAKRLRKRVLSLICLGVLGIVNLAGLIAAGAREAIVMSIVSLIVLFLLRRDLVRSRIIRIFTLSALLFFLVIPYMLKTFEEIAVRYKTIKTPAALVHTLTEEERGRIQQAFVIPFQYSITFFMGDGLGKVGPSAGLFSGGRTGQTNAENTLNLSITEIGTIGVILWLVFHIAIVRRGFRIYKHIRCPEWKWYGTIPMSYILLLLLSWQFGQLVSFPANAGFWFMSGCLMSLVYIKEE